MDLSDIGSPKSMGFFWHIHLPFGDKAATLARVQPKTGSRSDITYTYIYIYPHFHTKSDITYIYIYPIGPYHILTFTHL